MIFRVIGKVQGFETMQMGVCKMYRKMGIYWSLTFRLMDFTDEVNLDVIDKREREREREAGKINF